MSHRDLSYYNFFLQMPNIKKLVAGDLVYDGVRQLTVTLVDPIQLFVTAAGQDGNTCEYRPLELMSSPPKKEPEGQRRRRKPLKRKIDEEEVKSTEPQEGKDSSTLDTYDDTNFFLS